MKIGVRITKIKILFFLYYGESLDGNSGFKNVKSRTLGVLSVTSMLGLAACLGRQKDAGRGERSSKEPSPSRGGPQVLPA